MVITYDPKLFEGTAWYYARYRFPYPAELFKHLVDQFGLYGEGKVLDLGCGTGQLALPLAGHAAHVVGVDPDREMLTEVERLVSEQNISNVSLLESSSWSLDFAANTFRLAVMGESFHWMDRHTVLTTLHDVLVPGGGVVVISRKFTYPSGFDETISNVLQDFLGEKRRAGSGFYVHPAERHEDVLKQSEFKILAPWNYHYSFISDIEHTLGFLYSTSYAARHLFGERTDEYEQTMRRRLLELNGSQSFTIQSIITALQGIKIK